MIIGRKHEISILQEILGSDKAELIALYGRRRVGKTYLIREYYKSQLAFECSGQYKGTMTDQLFNFAGRLDSHFPKRDRQPIPLNWKEAFRQLALSLDKLPIKNKKVIFLDELPWFDTHKSGFLSAFSYFWNSYATNRKDLIIVICGSAASWIREKVLGDKGGMHNRVTRIIRLLPFTLAETDIYLRSRNISFPVYQLLQLYMAIGGIPHYLNFVRKGKSVAQNINNLCFTKDGPLVNEFDTLYDALFKDAEKHVRIIRALSKKNKGLTRTELLKQAKLDSGGGSTGILKELEDSGFIMKVPPFGNLEKNTLYRLIDEYSVFYLRFMKHASTSGTNYWMSIINTPVYNNWGGYAFESFCLKHSQSIKEALQIAGISSTVYSWTGTTNNDGAQIDMLINRADGVINICEMKFSTDAFTITKAYARQLEQKLTVFKNATGTKSRLDLIFITTYGVKKNDHYGLMENDLTIQLFVTR